MAIGLEEKKSAVQPGLIILFVVTIVGASLYFVSQSGTFKKIAAGSGADVPVAVETVDQNINIDFNFLSNVVGAKGEEGKLESFPEFPKIEQSSGTTTGVQPGRENPFLPVKKSAIAAAKTAVTGTPATQTTTTVTE